MDTSFHSKNAILLVLLEIFTPIYAEHATVLATVCHLLWGVLVSASYARCQLDLEVIDILLA